MFDIDYDAIFVVGDSEMVDYIHMAVVVVVAFADIDMPFDYLDMDVLEHIAAAVAVDISMVVAVVCYPGYYHHFLMYNNIF